MANIIEQIEAYLKFQKEVYGDYLIIEKLPKRIIEDKAVSIAVPNILIEAVEVKNKDVKALEQILPIVTEEPIDNIIEVLNINENEKVNESISSVDNNWQSATVLDDLRNKICNCTECPLGNSRRNFVFGSGSPDADIMVIGEGPGAEEDAQGLPFVGRSGQLLTQILKAINFERDEVFIANIVKCRPPNNRRPEPSEVAQCEPYLKKQIDIIKPKFILALGLTAVDTLFKTKHKMGEIRGQLMNYHGIATLATYHPAALLRNPNFKKDTWANVQYLRKLYDEYLETHK